MRAVGDPKMILEKMPTRTLESLRAEVEAMIATKVAERREELQSQLSKLLEISGSKNGTRRGRAKTRSVAAKYRNPNNADEVWSGRGRMPLWLGAEIKAGKTREDFLIA
jgi:DNA-binding protein H-NS